MEMYPAKQLVKNFEIKKRVAQPELYDRCGNFCAYEQDKVFHPSMSMVQVARQAQSE